MKYAVSNSWLKWILLAVLPLSSACAEGQTAVLLQAASVSRDDIRLSDLLPPNASTRTRQAGEKIELGKTPQCHTARVFEPSEIEKRITSWPALQGISVPGPVSVERACFPVRREEVEHAIFEFARSKQITLAEPSLRWAGTIYASQQNPILEVEQALPDPLQPALQIRLRCVKRAVCSSFLVTVPTTSRSHPPSAQHAPVVSAANAARPSQNGTALVESGQRVMLVFEDPPLRMQLPVTCLQRGALGEQVRAMDPSSHRVFRAEVTGVGTLMAHL
jgi:hypothetical protein